MIAFLCFPQLVDPAFFVLREAADLEQSFGAPFHQNPDSPTAPHEIQEPLNMLSPYG